jgi:hypothetical protein
MDRGCYAGRPGRVSLLRILDHPTKPTGEQPLSDQNEYRFPGPPVQGETAAASMREAEHWAEVYRQLIVFEEGVLSSVREKVALYPPDVRKAVEETNIRPLEVLIEQCRERLQYWETQHISIVPEPFQG